MRIPTEVINQATACDLEDFWRDQGRWSYAVFGPRKYRGPKGPLRHLQKELENEIIDVVEPGIYEYVDMFFLIIDAARRAGFSYRQFWNACWHKLAINKRRKWPDWRERIGDDQPMEHIRD